MATAYKLYLTLSLSYSYHIVEYTKLTRNLYSTPSEKISCSEEYDNIPDNIPVATSSNLFWDFLKILD